MTSPFPGMDPFLEHPTLWPQVHHQLMGLIAEALASQLGDKYDVLLEERRYEVVGEEPLLSHHSNRSRSREQSSPRPPDEALPTQPITVRLPMPRTIKEDFLEVREVDSEALVTVVEILSHHHKQEGMSRQKYEQRRHKILESLTHLVEIDLLRQGESMPMLVADLESDYRILISRSQDRPDADLYAFDLIHRLPTFPIPLLSEESEPMIDLQEIFTTLYREGGYRNQVNYDQEPTPELSEEESTWMDERLRRRGVR